MTQLTALGTEMVPKVIYWFQQHKRDLPWRSTRDPYFIWLSEIILQQTRVAQGLPYFYQFVEKYPTLIDFAKASQDDILKLWQGLGYYSRARHMHETAQLIVQNYAGVFPTSYQVLLQLKGIGDYTAAAIASFAADEPAPTLDGNVFRLLSRYFGIEAPINSSRGKTIFKTLANELIDLTQPGVHNQAMMEFGALQCKPTNPACADCPINVGCYAYNSGKVRLLPIKLRPNKLRERYFNFILAKKDSAVLMNKRGPGDIWQNLYELPLFETNTFTSPAQLVHTSDFKDFFGDQVRVRAMSSPLKHRLTHQQLFAQCIEIDNFSDHYQDKTNWFYATPQELKALAQPKLIVSFLEQLG